MKPTRTTSLNYLKLSLIVIVTVVLLLSFVVAMFIMELLLRNFADDDVVFQ